MSDDQLIFDIGARTDSFAASLLKLGASASSAMSLIEGRAQTSADKLSASFKGVGSSSTFDALTKGMSSADAGAKALGTRLEGIRATLAKTALMQKVSAAGGVANYASSLADSAGPALFAGGAAIAGFEAIKLSLDAVISASKEAEVELARLVKIGTDSRNLGVSTKFLQQFSEGSKRLGLEASELTGILEKLRDNSKVSIGTGDDKDPKSSGQTAIGDEITAGNLPKGADKAFNAADTQEARLRAVLALLDELQSKGAKLAEIDLAGKLLGDDFATKLRADDTLVAKLQARITDIAAGKGAEFVPQDQIDKAKELDAEIEDLNQRIINAMTPYHNDLRGWQQEELAATLELKGYYVDLVEVFGKLYAFADSIGKSISSWGNNSFLKSLNSAMDSMGLLDRTMTMGPFPQKGADPTEHSLTVTKPRGDTSKPLPEKDTKEKGAGAEKNDAVDTLIDELTKAAAVEKAEADTQGLSNKAKQEAIDLAKLASAASREDRAATADETAQILKLADASAKAKDQIASFNQKQSQAKELAGFLGSSFEESVEKLALGGGKIGDVLKSVVLSLEKAALQAAILGSGPLAGLFGSAAPAGATGAASVGGLFGNLFKLLPGHATGGQISGPGTGTSDSIPSMLSTGEFVVNSKSAGQNLGLLHAINGNRLPKFASGGSVGAVASPSIFSGGGSGSGDVHFHNAINVNASGGTPAQNADLASQVSKSVQAMVGQQVSETLRKQMRTGNILSGSRPN